MTNGVLIAVIWMALGFVVVGLLNVAKRTMHQPDQEEDAPVRNSDAWPTPSGIRTAGFESTRSGWLAPACVCALRRAPTRAAVYGDETLRHPQP